MYIPLKIETLGVHGIDYALQAMRNPKMSHDRANKNSDINLARNLIKAGDEHAKSMRGVMVWFNLDFQIGFGVEWATYKIGIEVLSTSSTMLSILLGMKGKALAELKQAELANTIYHQTAMASYQALRRIYLQRLNHRHPDWGIFCNWITTLDSFSELIYPEWHIAQKSNLIKKDWEEISAKI